MLTSHPQNVTAVTTPHWRKSLAIAFLGFVALLANIDFEQNRELQASLSGKLGQVESAPRADLALLLHKDLPLLRLATLFVASGDDEHKDIPAWISLAAPNLNFSSTGASRALTSVAFIHYVSLRSQTYSPRAPPRS